MTAAIPLYIQGVFAKTNLYFANNCGKWVSLPAWGTFFINVGRWIAEAETGENRLVLALAIPTRNYAAALAALGVVLARANIPTDQIDINSHFQRLSSLPIGTAVNYQRYDRTLKGIYQGVEIVNGEQRLRIQTENKINGSLKYLVFREESLNVKIAPKQNICLPKKQAGRSIVAPSEFLHALIDTEPQEFATKTRLECAIIGRFNILEQEMMQVRFACYSSKSELKIGYLHDSLRVRNFFSEAQAYRSEVLPAQGNNPPETTNKLIPHVIIFDGAAGFIKWRNDWRNSHWIVLLERTEPHFQEAVTEINSEYGNRVDGEEIHNIPSVPPGVELVVYQEARQ